MNKQERIRFFAQPAFQEGRVYFRQGTFANKLRNQLISFPHGDKVDLLDALASAIHLVRFPETEEDLREEREADERRKELKPPRTSCGRNYGGYI